MFYYLVGVNRVVSKTNDKFTYRSDQILEIGQIIQVPIGKQTAVGVVIQEASKPEFETKQIICKIEKTPLPKQLLDTLLWMSDFYMTSLAGILQTALPSGILKNRREIKTDKHTKISQEILKPTEEQQQIIDKIIASKPQTHLLHGVTGSGKTTVYIELIRHYLSQQKSSIIVVPEIALTAQLTQQLSSNFNNVVIFHSNLTESQRHQIWQKCLNSSQPTVVIGTRSSLFLPINNLGLIVIDEAHEISSLRQDKNPKYSSSQVASKLAGFHQAQLILGSATPLISDYWLSEQKNCSKLSLSSTALSTVPPNIQLIDMRQKTDFSKNSIFSNQLIESIRNSLANNQQVLIFHNRRGSTSATMCKNCGWIAECPSCHIPLSLHSDSFNLKCHTCNYQQPVPTSCPECHSAEIEHRGIGTKLIEAEANRLFPEAHIRRFDADTPTDENVANSYDQLRNGEIDILIGTQVIAKGLNLPNLTTVGIIQADTGLFLPDFIAAERTFQLLTQVIGRVGRNANSTNVIMQTYQPNHPSVKLSLSQNYINFYKHEISLRKKNNYPPFCFLLKLTVSYKTEAVAIKHARTLANELRNNYNNVEIIGPAPSFYEKRGDKFYWQIIVKSKNRATLQKIVANLPQNWQFDLDSVSLL